MNQDTPLAILKACWIESIALIKPVIQRIGLELFWVALFLETLNQGFKQISTLPDETISMIGKINSILLSGLLWPTVFVLMTPVAVRDILGGIPNTSLKQNLKKNLNQLAIESLRVLGMVSLWTLALILPGLYKLFLFMFVPYIVQFSERYDKNEVDALEYSAQMIKKFWKSVLVTMLSFLSLTMLPQLFFEEVDPTHNPILYFGLFLICLLGQIWSDIGLYCLYRKIQNDFESTIQQPKVG